MEYNPPRLFDKVVARQRYDMLKNQDIFKDNPFVDYTPTYLDIHYMIDSGKNGKVILSNISKEKNEFEWYGKSSIVISNDLFEEYFDSEKYYSGSNEFLARINLDEYNKLLELIDDHSTNLRKSLKGDSTATEVLNEKVKSLTIFKGEFIDWFIERKITFPIAESTESFDDTLSLTTYQLEDLN